MISHGGINQDRAIPARDELEYTRRLLLPPRSLVVATVIVRTISDDDVSRRGRGMRSRKKEGRRDADRKKREKAKRGEINERIG